MNLDISPSFVHFSTSGDVQRVLFVAVADLLCCFFPAEENMVPLWYHCGAHRLFSQLHETWFGGWLHGFNVSGKFQPQTKAFTIIICLVRCFDTSVKLKKPVSLLLWDSLRVSFPAVRESMRILISVEFEPDAVFCIYFGVEMCVGSLSWWCTSFETCKSSRAPVQSNWMCSIYPFIYFVLSICPSLVYLCPLLRLYQFISCLLFSLHWLFVSWLKPSKRKFFHLSNFWS